MGLLTSGSKLYKMRSDPGYSTWVELPEVNDKKEGSPLVSCAYDEAEAEGSKVQAVKIIVDWYRSKGFRFNDEEVYYFDDKLENIKPFVDERFNARQVSCSTRDDDRGFCGGT